MKLDDLSTRYLEDILDSKLSEKECAEVLAAKIVDPGFLSKVEFTEQQVKNKGLLASIILANARNVLKKTTPATAN